MFLGLDIGTSAVKAIIVNRAGLAIAGASVPLEISRPKPGWSEQDPDAWWRAVCAGVLQLPAQERGAVEAIGLAGQMHGAVLLGDGDRVLRPAILWNDGRSAAQCRTLEEREPRSRAITGNAAMPGFTAPKLLWVREHEADVFSAIRHVLLPKDYVRLRMTGDHATDLSDASGTLWLDVGRRRWSDEMLTATDLTESQMPSLFEGSAVTGTLKADIAHQWGMAEVPVAAGGGDNAAGAVAVGAIDPGAAFLSLGTSGVLFAATAAFAPAPDQAAHAFCHALPGRWHQMAVLLSAASAFEWAVRFGGDASHDAATAAAGQRDPFSGPEIFLPYLSGERTPHNDPDARGALVGLDHDSDGASLILAVLEGVAFAFADGLDVLEAAGTGVGQIQVIGGGARVGAWAPILAAALNRTLIYGNEAEVGPALGAARLARLAVGDEPPEAVCSPPPTDRIVEPDPALEAAAALKRARFRSLYPALKGHFA